MGTVLKQRKGKKNLPSCAHVLGKTKNLVISRCCFAEFGKEIYQNVKRTCRVLFWLINPIVLWRSRCRRRCLSSIFLQECHRKNRKDLPNFWEDLVLSPPNYLVFLDDRLQNRFWLLYCSITRILYAYCSFVPKMSRQRTFKQKGLFSSNFQVYAMIEFFDVMFNTAQHFKPKDSSGVTTRKLVHILIKLLRCIRSFRSLLYLFK